MFNRYKEAKKMYINMKAGNSSIIKKEDRARLLKLIEIYTNKIINRLRLKLVNKSDYDDEEERHADNISNKAINDLIAYIISSTFTDNIQDINSEIWNNIKVDFTIDEIESNYYEYQIIILRKVNNQLLIGCGDVNYQNYHEHPNYTSINVDIVSNPTIIAAFGFDINILKYYEKIGINIKLFALENVSIWNHNKYSYKWEFFDFITLLNKVTDDEFVYRDMVNPSKYTDYNGIKEEVIDNLIEGFCMI